MRGSSNPFQTAKELLKASNGEGTECGGFYSDSLGVSGESASEEEKGRRKATETDSSSSTVTSSIRAKAHAVAASLNSPSKAGTALSKKQRELAEAAKNSHSITMFFGKKRTEKTQVPPIDEGMNNTSPQAAVVIPTLNITKQEHSPAEKESIMDTTSTDTSPVEMIPNDTAEAEMKTEAIAVEDDGVEGNCFEAGEMKLELEEPKQNMDSTTE